MNSLLEFPVVFLVALALGLLAYFGALRWQPWKSKLSDVVAPYWADRAFGVLALVYAVTLFVLSALRFLSYNTDGYDLAIFDQVVWNSLRGRLFENTILPDAPLLIGQRFSPILLALVPLYAVWNSPLVLLGVQAGALAGGAFPLYWFARERLGRELGLVIAAAYFLYPPLHYVNLAEFHEVALAVPLFALASFFLLRRRFVPFLVSLGLTLLVKEEMGLTAIAFGVYVFFFQHKRWLGTGLALFGAVWMVVILQFFLPSIAQGTFGAGYYYFGKGIAAGVGRYEYLGQSLPEIIGTLVTRPDVVFQHVIALPKVEYLLRLLTPLAFIPLIGEVAILALPTLASSLLSDYSRQYSIEHHYAAPLAPFLFFAVVIGLARMLRWGNRAQEPGRIWAAGALITMASIASYLLHSPSPLSRNWDASLYTINARTQVGQALLRQITGDAVVVAQSAFLPQLSQRQRIYGFPADGVFCESEYLFADTTQYQYAMFANEWDAWLASGYFDVITRQDGFLLARRKPPKPIAQSQPDDRMVLLGASALTMDTPRGWRFMCVNAEWRAGELNAPLIALARLEDQQGHLWATSERALRAGQSAAQLTLLLAPTMPSGAYRVRVAVSVNDSNDAIIATLPIKKDTRSYTASQLLIEAPFFVDMREMRLLGYVPPPSPVAPGESLQLGIYWRARAKPRGDYLVVAQLRDASGAIALEHAARPANDTYPTTEWSAGEVLLDWHDLNLPTRLAAGEYVIFVILRDAANGDWLGEARLAPIAVK